MSKIFQAVIALLTIVGMFFGAYLFIDNKYALSATVKMIEQRLDYKIVSDQLSFIQSRIWLLEDRCKGNEMPESVLEEYRKLLEEKEMLKNKLNRLGGIE